MVPKIKGLINRTGESIKGFSLDPINNLGFLIPMAICLTSIISGIVTYIMFIVNGGYSSQAGLIKENGLGGISEGFTSGTTGLMVSGIVSKILLTLVAVELVVMLINYFKDRGKGMRIAMIVDLVVMGIVIALSTVVFWIAVGELVFSEEQLYQALGRFEGVTINLRTVLIAYVAVTLVSIICFVVFTLITAGCRWMFGYTALALVFANIVMPLFFLLLQNIIPIIGWFLVIVVGILVVKFIILIISLMSSDYPEDIRWQKEELAKAKERSSNYKASAEANFKSARDGLNIIVSAETKRKWGRDDLKKAAYEDEEIRRLEEDIDRLESKFGKQD